MHPFSLNPEPMTTEILSSLGLVFLTWSLCLSNCALPALLCVAEDKAWWVIPKAPSLEMLLGWMRLLA